MGQMLALLTGGFDLSVGTILALTSVVGAAAMAAIYAAYPDAVALAHRRRHAGRRRRRHRASASATASAWRSCGVSPFMMTLGMASIGFGIALFLTGGVPVYGMPKEFGKIFGFGTAVRHSGRRCSSPLALIGSHLCAAELDAAWAAIFYAVGGNMKASRSPASARALTLFMTYVLCGALTAISGIMLTARLETGEANIGASMPLESIAACVIGGVSLRGGTGRLENVVLGAHLHRPGPERHESRPDRILSADRGASACC